LFSLTTTAVPRKIKKKGGGRRKQKEIKGVRSKPWTRKIHYNHMGKTRDNSVTVIR